jgi:hypothetical protein
MEGPNHLTPEDFYHFIERGLEGCSSGRVERHLTDCYECLRVLEELQKWPDRPTADSTRHSAT